MQADHDVVNAIAVVDRINPPISEKIFFENLNATESARVRSWAQNYLFFSVQQAQLLAKVVGALPPTDTMTLSEVTKALFEEYGSGNPSEAHSNLFRRAAAAAGLNEEELDIAAQSGGATISAYVEEIRRAYSEGNVAEVLGTYAYLERSAVLSYPLMLGALTKLGWPSAALEFFRVHVIQEADHDEAASLMVTRLIHSRALLATFTRQVEVMHRLWSEFWDSLVK